MREVLIETIPAAFEMEEMLHELGDHAAALNAGRWDYLFGVCREVVDGVLGDRPNQLDRLRDDVDVTPEQLLDVAGVPGERTMAGLRANVEIALRYLAAWLAGVELDTGETVTEELVRRVIDEEVAAIRRLDHVDRARALFQQVARADESPDFLTLPAYSMID